MAFNKRTEIKGSKNLTVIAEGVKVEGKIFSPGSVRVDGKVKGDVSAASDIVIGKEGQIDANINTKDAVIAGSFKGNMKASGEVEITPTGKFIGNLTQKDALLTIARGGLFKGESVIDSSTDTVRPILEKKPDPENKSIK